MRATTTKIDHTQTTPTQTAIAIWTCLLTATQAQAQYDGGSGTPEDPYLIFNPDQMNAIGGLVGLNPGNTPTTVSNCYATSSVSGVELVGGLVGYNSGVKTTIYNSYATGRVSGENEVGGLMGRHFSGTVFDCYATGSVSGSK